MIWLALAFVAGAIYCLIGVGVAMNMSDISDASLWQCVVAGVFWPLVYCFMIAYLLAEWALQ
jgi:hypothetical protein